jgi:hypothetical protein
MGKIYRTAQGRQLDMETIRLQNEFVPALGNMRVNARGDQLGPGGQIIKTREMIMDEYYTSQASAADNIPQQGNIPTRSPARRQSSPLPTSSRKANEFTPDDAAPDEVAVSNTVDVEVKGGLAAALTKAQKTKKKD